MITQRKLTKKNMKNIQLGKTKIPVNRYATQGNAILGNRSAGKSYTATWTAECLMDAGIPIIAFDPIGVWHNLRIPGAGKGYKVVVAGGRHGDLPLTPKSAPEIVEAAMKQNIPLVIDLYSLGFSKSDWRAIVHSSIETLLYKNGDYGIRHIFLEEASEFCPQNIGQGYGQVYESVERLIRMGGNVSLGCTLINQRAEQVNKAVLELCECLILHRQKGKNSLDSLAKWIRYAEGVENANDIIQSLPGLESGQAWVWGGGKAIPELVQIPVKNSFHPDRENPTPAKLVKSSTDVHTFVDSLKGTLEKVLKEAEANDPKKLKTEIARLHRELDKRTAVPVETPKPMEKVEYKEISLLSPADLATLEKKLDTAYGLLQEPLHTLSQIRESLSRLNVESIKVRADIQRANATRSSVNQKPVQEPHPKAGYPRPFLTFGTTSSAATDDEKPTGGLRRMLIAMAQRPNLNQSQLALRAGMAQSGSFRNYISKGNVMGWLTKENGCFNITEAGLVVLGNYDPLPTGQALLEHWLNSPEVGGGARRMLRVLADHYPDILRPEEVARLSGMEMSGSFRNYVSKLNTLDLIEKTKDGLKASDEFFEN
jgi:hypothetical protein